MFPLTRSAWSRNDVAVYRSVHTAGRYLWLVSTATGVPNRVWCQPPPHVTPAKSLAASSVPVGSESHRYSRPRGVTLGADAGTYQRTPATLPATENVRRVPTVMGVPSAASVTVGTCVVNSDSYTGAAPATPG
jgi:hypothetical protein